MCSIAHRLFLDAMVVQQGRLTDKHKSANKDELLEMIRFGAEKVIKTGAVDNADFDIEEVLAAGKQKTAELTAKLKEMAGSSMAANFTMDGGAGSLYKMDAEDEEVCFHTHTHTRTRTRTRPQCPSYRRRGLLSRLLICLLCLESAFCFGGVSLLTGTFDSVYDVYCPFEIIARSIHCVSLFSR